MDSAFALCFLPTGYNSRVATQPPALGSLMERLRLRQVDLPLLLTTLLLVGAGLATLYSATYQWSPAVFRRQVMWLAVGAAGAIALAAIPPRVWLRFYKLLYALNVLMLLGVLVFGGSARAHNAGWSCRAGFSCSRRSSRNCCWF